MADELVTPLGRRVLIEALGDVDALKPGRCGKNTRDALIRRGLVEWVDGRWQLTFKGVETARRQR